MASLHQPTWTEYRLEGRRVRKDTPGAEVVYHKNTKWYGHYRDESGKEHRVPLSSNKAAAQQMLNAIVNKVEMAKAGIVDPFEQHRKKPLSEHLADYKAAQAIKGVSAKQVKQVLSRAHRVIKECGFVFVPDISASRVAVVVSEMLTRRKHPEPMSVQTKNFHLKAIKQVLEWMLEDRRIPENILSHLRGANPDLDRRHDRQTLRLEQVRAILQAATSSKKRFRKIGGRDRYFLYLTALNTGYRAGELAELMVEDFALDESPPSVNLIARKTKNKKIASQPIPNSVADALREYLHGRTGFVWPGTWSEKPAKMLRYDLKAADVPYVIEGPEGPLFADFHSLRHTYVAMLEMAGLSLKEAMRLARHSDPRLTMKRYGKLNINDLAGAINRLPDIQIVPSSQELRATGTDGAGPACIPACAQHAQADDSSRILLMDSRPMEGGGRSAESTWKTGDCDTDEEGCSDMIKLHPAGFEPATFGSVDRVPSSATANPGSTSDDGAVAACVQHVTDDARLFDRPLFCPICGVRLRVKTDGSLPASFRLPDHPHGQYGNLCEAYAVTVSLERVKCRECGREVLKHPFGVCMECHSKTPLNELVWPSDAPRRTP